MCNFTLVEGKNEPEFRYVQVVQDVHVHIYIKKIPSDMLTTTRGSTRQQN
jgi:hypothetical protein